MGRTKQQKRHRKKRNREKKQPKFSRPVEHFRSKDFSDVLLIAVPSLIAVSF